MNKIHAAHGKMTVKELAIELRVSERSLHYLFEKSVGVSPKMYVRLTRFHHAFQQLSIMPQHDKLTQLAFDLGYFDQSHFIRDFQKFTAHSPGAYVKNPVLKEDVESYKRWLSSHFLSR